MRETNRTIFQCNTSPEKILRLSTVLTNEIDSHDVYLKDIDYIYYEEHTTYKM